MSKNKKYTPYGSITKYVNRNNKNIPTLVVSNRRSPVQGRNLQVKPVGRKAGIVDKETIAIPAAVSFTTAAVAGILYVQVQHADVGLNTLPSGGRYVDEDNRFNTSGACVAMQVVADNPVLFALLLHVRESTADVYTTQGINITGTTSTLEEYYEANLPAGEHDFEIMSPFKLTSHSTVKSDLSKYIWHESCQIDVTSVFNKLEAEYWSTVEHEARKYDLVLLTFAPVATTSVVGQASLIIQGKRTLSRNRLL
jgi:hypothetical protein